MIAVRAQPNAAASSTDRIVIVSANSAWNIANFRARLIKDLVANGYRVVAVATEDGHSARIAKLGAEFRAIGINSSGLSVIEDARLYFDYLDLLRDVRPFAFLGFTTKPNIYGSLAASRLGIKVINNVSGLGTAFIESSPLTILVSWLYRIGLRKSARVFFQNPHDQKLFVGEGIVRGEQTALIPGSGVDLDRFKPSGRSGRKSSFRFLFVGRLLWDKGVGEYVEAAHMLRDRWPKARFQVLGFAGADNRTAVPSEEIARWKTEGQVEYLGDTDDVRPFLEQADCIVLPSYREGLPRSLLEASAMARPMIATDVPGCCDVVVEGDTGFLCDARSAASLAAAMEKMLLADPGQRAEMGQRARARVEHEFDELLVSKAYLEALAA